MSREYKAGPIRRRPTHPGAILRSNIEALGLSINAAAMAIGVTRAALNNIVTEKSAISPEMALRLARWMRSSPEFWLRVQAAVDLWDAAQKIGDELAAIEPTDWEGREEFDE